MSFISSLFSKNVPVDLAGLTDWHSHILPGVDDGVQSLDESLEILNEYEATGLSDLWLTPHIMEEIPNETAYLKERFEELSSAYTGNIKLHLASENMIDNIFAERLQNNDLLPIGEDGKTLLVETSYYNSPMRFRETLNEIKSKGYYPLLAHPERYFYIDSFSTYRELKQQGVLFQLNLMSLCGHYGPVVKEKAMKMLSEGMYDRLGSDLHRIEHLHIIRGMKLPKSVIQKLEALSSKPL